MAESEKILGNAITSLFEELLQRQTLLKLVLLDTDFEHLTRVTRLKKKETGPHFVIDIPEGFKEAVANIDIWSIRFEFTGKDNINYVFTTIDGQIAGQQMHIKMPKTVERRQRRKLFRIDAPPKTKLCFSIQTTGYELDVIDISLGGSLAALVQTDRPVEQQTPFSDIQALKDVELVFPAEIDPQPIRIETAQIKRIKENPQTTRYEMALEFIRISKRHENRLNDLIYRLQRQYLRKRLPLDI